MFVLVSLLFEFITGELERITYGIFNFFTSIFVLTENIWCSDDQAF